MRMNKAQITEILTYWNLWKGERETGIERVKYVKELLRQKDIKEVSIVSGIRRSGKSTILLQVLKKAIEQGLPGENTLYVNFEEPAFAPHLKLEFLSEILDAYLEKFNPEGKILIVLDEVQYINGWEKFVRGLYDRGEKIKFYVTGSSSKLLSKEYGAALTGRIYTNEIFPLSFKEFLVFKNKEKFSKKFGNTISAHVIGENEFKRKKNSDFISAFSTISYSPSSLIRKTCGLPEGSSLSTMLYTSPPLVTIKSPSNGLYSMLLILEDFI